MARRDAGARSAVNSCLARPLPCAGPGARTKAIHDGEPLPRPRRRPLRDDRAAHRPSGRCARDGDRQAAAAEAPRPGRGRSPCTRPPGGSATAGRAGARTAQRLHPHLRRDPAGPQRLVPASAHRGHARRRHDARAHHGAGRDRAAPAQRRQRAGRGRRRSVGVRARAGGEPLRARRRRARRPRCHADARDAGQAGPPLRRGGASHRHRAGRAALHGGLVGRAQGHRAGRGSRRHDPDLPQRALHGGPGGDPVQPGGQPAARGAARDRAHAGRGLRRQHRHRRAPRPGRRHLRRGDREPPRGRALRRGERARAGGTALSHRRHLVRRPSPRQDVLPDGEGDGDAARHPRAGRHADRRVVVLRGLRLGALPRSAGAPGGARARRLPRQHPREAPRRHRRVADRDAAQADARGPRAALSATASPARTGG